MNEKIPQGMERADAYVYSFLMTVFKDTPSVVRFLIQPEIMKKFNEEERAYMFETYCNLTGTAFEEIAEDDNPWTEVEEGVIYVDEGYVATDYIPTGLNRDEENNSGS